MSDRTVTVQVEGALEDQGRIRLSEFTRQLEAVKSALRETERLVSGSVEPVLYYRIVDVKRASPFTVVIEAVPYERPTVQGLARPTIASVLLRSFSLT
jgi:BioD-like phosphotransacetylase family protein